MGKVRRTPRGSSQPPSQDVAHVVTRMRDGASLTSAAAEYGIDRRTVQKYARPILYKTKGGHYRVRARDNLIRELKVPVYGGYDVYAVRGSGRATLLSNRLHAQRYFLETGDDSEINELRDTVVQDIHGREVPFLTDLDELERLGAAGALSFESMYAHSA
jgi:hypothetical protein